MNRLQAMNENLKNESIKQKSEDEKDNSTNVSEFSIVYDLEIYPFFRDF